MLMIDYLILVNDSCEGLYFIPVYHDIELYQVIFLVPESENGKHAMVHSSLESRTTSRTVQSTLYLTSHPRSQ